MSEDKYSVYKRYLKTADYQVLVISIPEEDLEDKLAYFAREKGKITKSMYEEFLIATFIANINQLLYHISNNLPEGPIGAAAFRDELISVILDVNEKLAPSNIYINHNYILKLKPEDGELDGNDRLLDETKFWNTSPKNVMSDAHEKIQQLKKHKDKREKLNDKKPPKKTKGEVKKPEDLEYTTTEKWWKRLGRYVTIKKFNKEDAEHLLAKRYFHNRTSFQTFVVTVCVEDFEGLFNMLDDMKIPSRVASPILINELYELCLSCNDFLTFENAQELVDEPIDENSCEHKQPRKTGAGAQSMSQYINKTPKKTFKDVPKEDLLKLADNMNVFLVGQQEAVDVISNAVKRASVGLKDPSRPIGSFLFAGRTGVGKTLATKVLADELIKDKDNIITIDCSEYSADHEYSKLIGSPSGYVGHEAGGVLTNAMQKNPFRVVVFDEIEKASYRVHELLLQILEEGRLTDGKGKAAPFNNAIVIMTSNIGVKEVDAIGKTIGFGDVAEITDERKDKALDEALKKKFKPEFLNRIDSVVHFKNLKKQDYMRIIDIELYKLNDNLKSNDTEYSGITLDFSKNTKTRIYKEGINEKYGARPLKRCIEKEISNPLAEFCLSEKFFDKAVVSVSFKRGKIKFDIKREDPEEAKSVYEDVQFKKLSGKNGEGAN